MCRRSAMPGSKPSTNCVQSGRGSPGVTLCLKKNCPHDRSAYLKTQMKLVWILSLTENLVLNLSLVLQLTVKVQITHLMVKTPPQQVVQVGMIPQLFQNLFLSPAAPGLLPKMLDLMKENLFNHQYRHLVKYHPHPWPFCPHPLPLCLKTGNLYSHQHLQLIKSHPHPWPFQSHLPPFPLMIRKLSNHQPLPLLNSYPWPFHPHPATLTS